MSICNRRECREQAGDDRFCSRECATITATCELMDNRQANADMGARAVVAHALPWLDVRAKEAA